MADQVLTAPVKKNKLQRLKTITNRSTKSNDEKQTIQDNVNKKQTKKTVT